MISTAAAHVHTACWQRVFKCIIPQPLGTGMAKISELLPQCYSIFTQLLRYLYDFPPSVCHIP
jgi:hypothetical protein